MSKKKTKSVAAEKVSGKVSGEAAPATAIEQSRALRRTLSRAAVSWLQSHRDDSVEQLVADTGVTASAIKRWLEENQPVKFADEGDKRPPESLPEISNPLPPSKRRRAVLVEKGAHMMTGAFSKQADEDMVNSARFPGGGKDVHIIFPDEPVH